MIEMLDIWRYDLNAWYMQILLQRKWQLIDSKAKKIEMWELSETSHTYCSVLQQVRPKTL